MDGTGIVDQYGSVDCWNDHPVVSGRSSSFLSQYMEQSDNVGMVKYQAFFEARGEP
jgi:hypothetical protein